MITPEELKRIGCDTAPSGDVFYLWLGGVVTNVSLACSVRDNKSMVYIVIEDGRLFLPHVDSIAKFCALYSLLTGQAKA